MFKTNWREIFVWGLAIFALTYFTIGVIVGTI